jgi:hypothetical protein
VLCFNCNSAKGFYGYCPHSKAPETNASTVRSGATPVA